MSKDNVIDFGRHYKGPSTGDMTAAIGSISRTVTPGIIHEVEENIRTHGKMRDGDLRILVSRNLGRLLEPIRGSAALTTALEASGVSRDKGSTKHLPRYAIFSNRTVIDPKNLSPSIVTRVRIAKAAAGALGMSEEDALLDLVADTRFVPNAAEPQITPADREVVDSLVGLTELLRAACRRIIEDEDLDGHFRSIARLRLISGDGANTFTTVDHPAASTPDDDDFWLERLDLIPMMPIIHLPSTPVFEADMTIAGTGRSTNIRVTPIRTIGLGIAPASKGRRAIATLFDMPLLQIVADDGTPGTVSPVENQLSNERAVLAADGTPIGVVSGPEIDRCLGLAEGGATITLKELTEPHLFGLLHQLPSEAGMFQVLDDIDNTWLTQSFLYPSRAPAGSVCGYLERHLLNSAFDDPFRLDNRLRLEAKRIADSVRSVAAEIQGAIEARHASFLRQQESRRPPDDG